MIIICTGCGRSLKVADEHAGRRARCPSCSTVVSVPAAQSARVSEPAMQQAAVAASSSAATAAQAAPRQQQPLPMSRPNVTFDQPPRQAAPAAPSTALIPAPASYAGSRQYAGPSRYAAPPQPHYNGQYQQPYHQLQPYRQGPPRPHQADPGIAALLEVLGGMFAQTFGIGHLYAGNIAVGLLFMFGYWFLCFVNILLMFVFIGILTYPLCWLLMMIISPIVAATTAKRY